jgi:hypothetical protein
MKAEPIQEDVIRFSVYAPKTKQIVIYDYYLTGNLRNISFNDNAKGGFVIASIQESPISIMYLPGQIPIEFRPMIHAKCEVKDITNIDLSFTKFWNTYGYKRGNMERTKKLWEKLTAHEKILALGFINKLKSVYDTEQKAMPYPETYLAQKRWNNEL